MPAVIDQEIQILPTEILGKHIAHALDKRGKAGAVANVQLQHQCSRTEALDLLGYGLGVVGLAEISPDDVDALRSQVQGGATAQSAAGTCDQCEFAFHDVSPNR